LSLKLLVLGYQPAISFMKESFKVLYPFVASKQLPFSDTSFLLQCRILIDKLDKGSQSGTEQQGRCEYLFLDQRQLLQIALQERHLFLLRLAVAVANDVIVLLFELVQLDFELHHLMEQSQQ
jgi:hypothetical protein